MLKDLYDTLKSDSSPAILLLKKLKYLKKNSTPREPKMLIKNQNL